MDDSCTDDRCPALWAEVIHRAITDATEEPPPRWVEQKCHDQVAWLAIHDEAMHFCIGEETRWQGARECVCDAAGVNHERFRARMVILIAEVDARTNHVWDALRASVALQDEERRQAKRAAAERRAVENIIRRRAASSVVPA
jgi:hypothetical protein